MEECEMCGKRATMYCESDQAKLCWDCDEKVHGANFLVEKHLRTLLCNVCQSPTPWNARGPKLTRTVSVCEDCIAKSTTNCEQGNDDEDEDIEDDGNYSSGSDYDDYEEEEEEEEEEGENQVVPWSAASSPLPPLASSCGGEGETSIAGDGLGLKRLIENSSIDDEICCSFAQTPFVALPNYVEATSQSFFRPLKQPKITGV
ncbi:Zinc finger, B-box [Quillaja saponaria]|uniref:Zinc finger, B-box n=1 Tax=Quillaja saponaria TaxID=32244 RepID=A0AAD7VNA6_QUISA|nr:Zinc finger, B-box [Quillaja saponaria]